MKAMMHPPRRASQALRRLRRIIRDERALTSFYGFQRANFGIVQIRTDTEPVVVFTHTGKEGMRETYRFTVVLSSPAFPVISLPKE
jgi:hypothetical protein